MDLIRNEIYQRFINNRKLERYSHSGPLDNFIRSFFLSGFKFNIISWLCFLFIIIVHEIGHAAIILKFRLTVEEIVLHGFGGYCRWYGDVSEIQRAVIAWGGIIGQIIIIIFAKLSIVILLPPVNAITTEVYRILIGANIFIIFINLIPLHPLDGAHAFKIFTIFHTFIKKN